MQINRHPAPTSEGMRRIFFVNQVHQRQVEQRLRCWFIIIFPHDLLFSLLAYDLVFGYPYI